MPPVGGWHGRAPRGRSMPPSRSPTTDAARAPIYRARERTGASGALSRRSIGHRSFGRPHGARPRASVSDLSASERRRSVPCASMLDLSALEALTTPGSTARGAWPGPSSWPGCRSSWIPGGRDRPADHAVRRHPGQPRPPVGWRRCARLGLHRRLAPTAAVGGHHPAPGQRRSMRRSGSARRSPANAARRPATRAGGSTGTPRRRSRPRRRSASASRDASA